MTLDQGEKQRYEHSSESSSLSSARGSPLRAWWLRGLFSLGVATRLLAMETPKGERSNAGVLSGRGNLLWMRDRPPGDQRRQLWQAHQEAMGSNERLPGARAGVLG